MRSNRGGIPSELKCIKDRQPESTMTVYSDVLKGASLTSYVAATKTTKKKLVLILSSYFGIQGSLKPTEKRPAKRPAINCLYNFTKGNYEISFIHILHNHSRPPSPPHVIKSKYLDYPSYYVMCE